MQLEQLGPYRLGEKLGQGGMGAVYEAVDVDTGEAAAVKVLSPMLAAEEGFRVRFEAEIESLKKLRHPNIVRLYGYGEQSGTLFYAMELVRGTSLEDELRAGRRFDWREVTGMSIKLCRALKHAHDHGVIHRDLKPANLLLTPDGDIKLSDFGIARLFGNTRLTSDGGVLGTAEYMAPEQADGRVVTDRCDQYSLGGVMYALLAGRPPFRAKTLVEMLQLQRYSEPDPVTRYAPHAPAELARIIHQLLEKDPHRRFANMLILSRAMEAMERGLSIAGTYDDDFVITGGEGPVHPASGTTGLPPTLVPSDLLPASRAPWTGGTPMPTEATLAYDAEVESMLPPAQAGSRATQPPGKLSDTSVERFTKVQPQADERPGELAEAISSLLNVNTLSLVGAIGLLIAAGWYFLSPPSADALYRQIETATTDDDPASWNAAKPQIDAFLARYPNDARAEQVRSLADELEDDARQADPVKRAYTEAKRYVAINPDLAATRLHALIDVYGDDADASETARKYVTLAEMKLKDLDKRRARHVDEDRKQLESRLDKADELAADQPADARKIYEGVIALYSDKPWAAELVQRARVAAAALAAK
jgi:hypothetical protein